MKLTRAHIKNFRLLKDLTLDFSTDEEKPLTVIRAANESGKTTSEYALMWALYGSKAVLPNKGDYALFPLDLKSKGENKIEVSVEVEFEADQVISTGRGSQSIEKRVYRITRSCIEYANGEGSDRRHAEKICMYRQTSSGSEPMTEAEAKRVIENALPQSLKDVYFTDGDSAMSFIEAAATIGVKRKRVSNAVEALLGLQNLKKTVKHLENVAAKFTQEIDDTDYGKRLEELNDQIGGFTEDLEEWESQVSYFEQEISVGQKSLKSLKVTIEDLLKLGDKAILQKDIQDSRRQLMRLSENAIKDLDRLSRLISCEALSKALLVEPAQKSMHILNDLNKDNKLPKANIPILEELLDRDACFCGADLSPSTKDGEKRRSEISNAIDSSRTADAIQEVATGLFYRARSVDFSSENEAWLNNYKELSGSLQNTQTMLRDGQSKLRGLDQQVDQIEDSKLKELREEESQFEEKLLKLNNENSKRAAQIEEYVGRKKDAERERAKVENKFNKTNTGASKIALARESQKLFERIIEKLKQDELKRVGEEMNRIFLKMIGSDPESNDLTLITKAELTDDYDIRVFGPKGHELNPDQDLNGASRRAITIAFILALTKVSEVQAPNVIDTPLGMMSGYVKQQVLLQTIKEGSQVVLFLTHDEIKGVEDILDLYAGKVYTFTNPAHYPRMLKNEPTIEDSRIIRCECGHRDVCSICERKNAGV